jgi:acetyltransferase
MDIETIRAAVLETVAAIAPECDPRALRPDQPLRDQVDLDSMDWLNLVVALEARLGVDIPDAEQGKLATLDALVACLAAQPAARRPARPEAVPAGPADAANAAIGALPQQHRVDGRAVTLRPIRPDDAPLEADFVSHLSAGSRYARFMRTLHELPPDKLKYLTDVDGVRHVALVATTGCDGREAIVGVARYIVDPAGTGCEFAVTVDDAWQGSGAAGLLMQALIDTARARGLQRMEAIMLTSNRRMLKFARQLGFKLERDPQDHETVRALRSL